MRGAAAVRLRAHDRRVRAGQRLCLRGQQHLTRLRGGRRVNDAHAAAEPRTATKGAPLRRVGGEANEGAAGGDPAVGLVVTGIGTVDADGFDFRAALGRHGYKYLPAASQYFLAAAKRALAQAGPEALEAVGPEERGAAVGTNSAAVALHHRMDRTVTTSGAGDLSPVTAPYFSINLFGSRLATEHDLKGFNLTFTSPRVAGLEALQTGQRALLTGRARRLLVGATEEALPEGEPGAGTSEAGAVALVLEPEPAARSRGVAALGRVGVRSFFLPPKAAASAEGPSGPRRCCGTRWTPSATGRTSPWPSPPSSTARRSARPWRRRWTRRRWAGGHRPGSRNWSRRARAPWSRWHVWPPPSAHRPGTPTPSSPRRPRGTPPYAWSPRRGRTPPGAPPTSPRPRQVPPRPGWAPPRAASASLGRGGRHPGGGGRRPWRAGRHSWRARRHLGGAGAAPAGTGAAPGGRAPPPAAPASPRRGGRHPGRSRRRLWRARRHPWRPRRHPRQARRHPRRLRRGGSEQSMSGRRRASER
ncbi:beta-ketoacyl synthase N-terminal-like domain-containing protein [Streptomyces malaysiensis]|uniref:beta-ketoacyl synthase N-terminal-like domain-containing protein n=1 Tax=Streptomyces malaysiensis TaxID=92644 RepID=UPI0031B637FF